MEANTRAAAENRISPETFIIARIDAREVYDLDEALRRGERYIRAGADGLFIEALVNIDELEKIGRAFEVPQLANMLEGRRTPVLTPTELQQIGFRIVIYGISLLMHAVRAMDNVLADLAQGRAADHVDRIPKGTSPGDLSVRQQFERRPQADWIIRAASA